MNGGGGVPLRRGERPSVNGRQASARTDVVGGESERCWQAGGD